MHARVHVSVCALFTRVCDNYGFYQFCANIVFVVVYVVKGVYYNTFEAGHQCSLKIVCMCHIDLHCTIRLIFSFTSLLNFFYNFKNFCNPVILS